MNGMQSTGMSGNKEREGGRWGERGAESGEWRVESMRIEVCSVYTPLHPKSQMFPFCGIHLEHVKAKSNSVSQRKKSTLSPPPNPNPDLISSRQSYCLVQECIRVHVLLPLLSMSSYCCVACYKSI